MTEYQAWRYLEKKWGRPKLDNQGDYCVRIKKSLGECWGLCYCISDLVFSGKIGDDTKESMNRKIKSCPGYAPLEYIWPMNESGARSRALFCKKQAELLRRKNA